MSYMLLVAESAGQRQALPEAQGRERQLMQRLAADCATVRH